MVVPALIPLTTPVELPTVATAVLLLLHVPPPVAHESVVEPPAQALVVPVIAAGTEFTVRTAVDRHPLE
jgi:hypothetical protein